MNLYEVIFWGAEGRADDADTIYLVRAPDFRSAVEFVSTNASPSNHGGARCPLAHVVYELGRDASPHAETGGTSILRGPYFQCAYNFGWRVWNRKLEGSDYTREWEEETHAT
jgi:hypothetical protein